MTISVIEFTVLGTPQQRGSKIAQPIYSKGKPVIKNGRPVCVTRDQNDKKSLSWMQEVRAVALSEMRNKEIDSPQAGGVSILVYFNFLRPKNHYGTGKNAKQLKPNAPAHNTKTPDIDKLCRCFLDSLTGIVFRDDSEVFELTARKRYSEDHPSTEATIIFGID